jgi:hypothetical protein
MTVLSDFTKNFNNAMDKINKYLTEDSELKIFANWFINQENNTNSFYWIPENWISATDNAISFVRFLNYIHYCIVDDGDMCFVDVNGDIRMLFIHKQDVSPETVLTSTEKNLLKYVENEPDFPIEYEIKILDITLNDFPKVYEEYQVKRLKVSFTIDVGIADSLEEVVKEYSNNKYFDSAWIEEFKNMGYK